MAKTSLVLTLIGKDRPGLVESVARIVADHDANWLESRMAHLAGHFAGILRVEVAPDRSESLAGALRSLDEADYEAIVHADASPPADDASPLLLLDLAGADHPGIVRAVTRVLAAQGVNVEELSTETTEAPNTGQPIFHATAKLRLPPGVAQQTLREALEAVAADLVVDIKLAPEG